MNKSYDVYMCRDTPFDLAVQIECALNEEKYSRASELISSIVDKSDAWKLEFRTVVRNMPKDSLIRNVRAAVRAVEKYTDTRKCSPIIAGIHFPV